MPLADTADPKSLSTRLRKKRDVYLKKIISDIYAKKQSVSIIDIGGTTEYWQRVGFDFLSEHNCTIDIYNLEQSELNPNEQLSEFVTLKVGNGCDLRDVKDNNYDLSHSNSVIEHVRSWENMELFAKESQRVAESHYMQTPYFWFPIDPHFYKMPFFHWLPRPVRRKLMAIFPLAYRGKIKDIGEGNLVLEGAVLLDKSEALYLFPKSNIRYERLLGFPKSLIVSA